ncbi:MAG: hypothetical protein ACLFTT_11160 [Candidatus Hydrogenedentota bacterium]
MSTSFLYHGFGIRGYEYVKTEYRGRLSLKHYSDSDLIHIVYLSDVPDRIGGTKEALEYLDSQGAFAVDKVPALMQRHYIELRRTIYTGILPEGAKLPRMSTYMQEKYPEGLPYKYGGPWRGEAPLQFEEHDKMISDILGKETYGGKMLKRTGPGSWTMYTDGEGQVAAIFLYPNAVEALFNAADMSAEEFAQSFIDAYGIPEMQPEVDAFDTIRAQITGRLDRTGDWAYVDRAHGWALTIRDNKEIRLERITKADDVSFD